MTMLGLFWWSRDELTHPWRPFVLGGNEYGRRCLGVRLPGGMLFVPLWRFRGWRGPCARCGEWEAPEFWRDPHCIACHNDPNRPLVDDADDWYPIESDSP